MARAAGALSRSVQRILDAKRTRAAPYRMSNLSDDWKFAEKLKDVVGLDVDPPARRRRPPRFDREEPDPGP